MELIELANDLEKKWEYYGFQDIFLEVFIFEHLIEKDTNEYKLMDLFSRRAILAIISVAEIFLTCKEQGDTAIRIGEGGGIVPAEVTDKYEKLIQKWQQAGWVNVQILAPTKEVKISLMF